MARVNVIVPVYNVEKYLCECIESILSQTYLDFELILVDDGSTDASGEICDKYKQKDKRITVIHKENGGLSSARNAGLDYAFSRIDSEYISFIDSDDSIDCNFLKFLVESIGNEDLAICYFKKIYEDTNEEILPPFMIDEKFDNISIWTVDFGMKGTLNVATNKLYRKKVFNGLRYEGKVCEDSIILHKMLMNCNGIVVVPHVLYFYRKHSGTLSTATPTVELLNVNFNFASDRFIYFYDRGLFDLSLRQYKAAIYTLISLIDQTDLRSQRSKIRVLKKYKSHYKISFPLTIFILCPRLFLSIRSFKRIISKIFQKQR